MSDNLGLYLHIPFCKSKCAYCDFYSLSQRNDYQRYVDALSLHIQDYSENIKDYTIDSVFIGGGTPTVLPKKNLIELIDLIYHNLNIANDAEFTIECNPATADYNLFKKLRSMGVNRLSIGMQSTCENELKLLSRIHTFEDFEECFTAARSAGFDNINVDLMYGIPEQSEASLKMSLESLCDKGPEHISLYGLKIEPNTEFFDIKNTLALPCEDNEYAMYETSINILNNYGYEQYEISNFSKPGFECKHNLKYWNCEEYLGLGPAAHSYLNGSRFSFKRDIDLYMNMLEQENYTEELIDEYYDISNGERMGEYVMLQLRLNRGIDTEDFNQKFNLSFDDLYAKYLKVYIQNGFMEKTSSGYAFTTKGKYVSNYILSAILDFDSNIMSNIAKGTDK